MVTQFYRSKTVLWGGFLCLRNRMCSVRSLPGSFAAIRSTAWCSKVLGDGLLTYKAPQQSFPSAKGRGRQLRFLLGMH